MFGFLNKKEDTKQQQSKTHSSDKLELSEALKIAMDVNRKLIADAGQNYLPLDQGRREVDSTYGDTAARSSLTLDKKHPPLQPNTISQSVSASSSTNPFSNSYSSTNPFSNSFSSSKETPSNNSHSYSNKSAWNK